MKTLKIILKMFNMGKKCYFNLKSKKQNCTTHVFVYATY